MQAFEKRLLSCKELAMALGRSPTYISAMRRMGFMMTANRATLEEARAFLRVVPCPRRKAGETRGK